MVTLSPCSPATCPNPSGACRPLRSGERLPYNNCTTIDWLHDLVKDSVRPSALRTAHGLGGRLYAYWDAAEGWIAATLIGMLTACIAAAVDVSVAAVADWKEGYCSRKWSLDREGCCHARDGTCADWVSWGDSWAARYAIYVGLPWLTVSWRVA
jgi:chloride channel 3/4/5